MDKLLSIIVPSYNMEHYLRTALDSLVIVHNFSSMEIIVVNDGSDDDTSLIAHDYSSKYPEGIVVIDKLNGHYGSCINAALKVVTGKYVKILDADDCCFNENLDDFIETLAKIDVDLVLSDYVKSFTSGKEILYRYDLLPMQVLPFGDICDTRAIYDILMPAITYRTEVLRQVCYYQTEGIPYTDLEWCFFPMTAVTTVFYFDKFIYNYKMGREGQTMDPVIYRKAMPQRIKVLSGMLSRVRNYQLTSYAKVFIDGQLVKHAWYVYEYYLKTDIKEDRTLLIDFDQKFRECAPVAYSRCDKFNYRLHVPYHFVKSWRNNPNNRIPVYIRAYSAILDIFGSFHVRMMKTNPNLER